MQTAINMDSGSSSSGGGTDWASLIGGLLSSQDSNSSGGVGVPSALDSIIDPTGSIVNLALSNKANKEAKAKEKIEFDRRQRMLDLIEQENNRKNRWWRGLRSNLSNMKFSPVQQQQGSNLDSLAADKVRSDWYESQTA